MALLGDIITKFENPGIQVLKGDEQFLDVLIFHNNNNNNNNKNSDSCRFSSLANYTN
jgi:hypothetical protein